MSERDRQLAATIANRLSLRPPQRRSLEILQRLTELMPLTKDADARTAFDAVNAEFPDVTDFERDFPSVCFALATGVGKTRLMGAIMSYLHLAHGHGSFFVLAPSLTIYDQLVKAFTPNMPKYVLKGISEFVVTPPRIVTGDNYDEMMPRGEAADAITIFIFNIAKLTKDVRGGQASRIRKFRETIGESCFEAIARRPDLVVFMDEAHRYRRLASVLALSELRPVVAIELTATPFLETSRGPVAFRNVIFRYSLGQAMADGLTKHAVVVTRENLDPAKMSAEAIEQLKLEDGLRLHEKVKAELHAFALQSREPAVKPIMLVIARDTAHAADLAWRLSSMGGGAYAQKTIQVDSSVEGDATIQRLDEIENPREPAEIVVHVNMLKEGWDVSNLYTIVPLRAAKARILIEQTIGRGLRLPYQRRTGVAAVDTLTIVAHDRFQEILDEARGPGSSIALQPRVVTDDEMSGRTISIESRPVAEKALEVFERRAPASVLAGFEEPEAAFSSADQEASGAIRRIIREWRHRSRAPLSTAQLETVNLQCALLAAVKSRSCEMPASVSVASLPPDRLAGLVAEVAGIVAARTIDIPRIRASSKDGARSGFRPFDLDVSGLAYDVPSDVLWAANLQTGETGRMAVGGSREDGAGRPSEERLVDALAAFDDVAYEECSELLYRLARQATHHLSRRRSDDELRRIIAVHGDEIARYIHSEMQKHFWHVEESFETAVVDGFAELHPIVYTADADVPPRDFRVAPSDRSNMARYLFCGFSRCLYEFQKFDSDPERRLAVILDREASKWFRPARRLFDIRYHHESAQFGYQPDFVAETATQLLILECKAADRMRDAEVLAKRRATVAWCAAATRLTAADGGKPWSYLLIPHDAIFENMTIEGLARRYLCQ